MCPILVIFSFSFLGFFPVKFLSTIHWPNSQQLAHGAPALGDELPLLCEVFRPIHAHARTAQARLLCFDSLINANKCAVKLQIPLFNPLFLWRGPSPLNHPNSDLESIPLPL